MGAHRSRHLAAAATAAALLVVLAADTPGPAGAAGTTVLVSRDAAGGGADGGSHRPSVSRDGRHVAFQSSAADLVPGDANGVSDVFVRDTVTGTTRRVSVDPGGGDADGASAGAQAVTADGRHVAFVSHATDLVAGDGNARADVFLRDLVAGTTTRVSAAVAATGSFRDVGAVDVSADGSRVVFDMQIYTADGSSRSQVHLWDRATGTARVVSLDPQGGPADGDSALPAISDDGRYVAFVSAATDLVPGDGGGFADVFRREVGTGATVRVSVDAAGGDADETVYGVPPSLSADGSVVAFASWAGDIVAGDLNGAPDAFVRTIATGVTVRASVTPSGGDGCCFGNSVRPALSLSGDGSRLAFATDFDALDPADRNGQPDVYVRDLRLGRTELVSVATGGTSGDGYSTDPSISADGTAVAFSSDVATLVADDADGRVDDIFLRRYAAPAPSCEGRPATIVGTTGADRLRGTAAADVITGFGGGDRIDGLGGDDVICAGPGGDVVTGGPGADHVYGEDGDDDIGGGPGHDRLRGGAGADRCTAFPGDDVADATCEAVVRP